VTVHKPVLKSRFGTAGKDIDLPFLELNSDLLNIVSLSLN